MAGPGCAKKNSEVEERTLSRPIQKFGFWTVVAIVLLRLGVGWHFYKEGAKKFEDDKFTSIPFWSAAKGPLAEFYKNMIPDRYGRERLLSPDKTLSVWSAYRDRIGAQYGFDEKQTKEANAVLERYKERLEHYLEENKATFDEYFLEVERLMKAKAEPMRDVPFRRDWINKKESELRGKLAPWTADIRAMDKQLESDLKAIATDGQAKRGSYPLRDPWKPWQDDVVKYHVVVMGVLLVLGLFTRFACLGAMAFLLSVMITQPPWVDGVDAQYFYYQMVEVLALFFLMIVGAGRYAGLDYVIYGVLARRNAPKA